MKKLHLKTMRKPNAVVLNNDQLKALEILKSDKNVFLSGAAGTGKSTLINYYKKHENRKIQVLCSTGLASILVGGRTFHSFFGIGIMNESLDVILDRIINNPAMVARLLKTDTILIDEISLLSGKALDFANYCAKMVRNDERPFGGIRVICVGDFFQLPPVTEYGKKIDWAFNSMTWQECEFSCIELKEFMRTKEIYFLKVLASIRKGLVGPEVTKFLNSKIIDPKEIDSFVGSRIFPRKDMVQKYNEKKLEEINSPIVVFKTAYSGEPTPVQRIKRNLPIDDEIILKEGAFVMIRVNDRSKDREYVNGTLGHITSINGDYSIVIKTFDGKYIVLKKHVFELKDGDSNVIATATNYPVQIAYAITTHRSQGSSIDRGLIDLKNLFASGMSYVALSRLTNSDGLKIIDWNRRSIFVDKEVLEFYRKIKENSR